MSKAGKDAMSHYCKICGCYKSNESFSGRGHRSHICKACHKLPVEKREEMMTIIRIDRLHFPLSKANKRWLNTLRSDPREAVRREAEAAWEFGYVSRQKQPSEEEEFFEEEEWPEETYLDVFGPEPEPMNSPSFGDVFDLPF